MEKLHFKGRRRALHWPLEGLARCPWRDEEGLVEEVHSPP